MASELVLEVGSVLAEDVPVVMPDLPATKPITTPEQLKAFADPLRTRILGIIQNQPATAKQIAVRLGIPPGTAGHHLQVLEAAGLAQVMARRLVRGIVSKYYTRTARIFTFNLPYEAVGAPPFALKMLADARGELSETMADLGEHAVAFDAFPHLRLTAARLRVFEQRLEALVDDFIAGPPDDEGQVYGLAASLFVAPAYMQPDGKPQPVEPSARAQCRRDADAQLGAPAPHGANDA
jgi:DNA-binding transcriptional ArsR family regulator